MKTKHLRPAQSSARTAFATVAALLGLVLFLPTPRAAAATNDIPGLLQKGLFEEEANHNLDAAIKAYQAIVTQTDNDHQFAATAVFHLAECFRKLGRTNEAVAQYQRIVRDFGDQTELVKLSRAYSALQETAAAAPTQEDAFKARAERLAREHAAAPPQDSYEASEIKGIQALIKDSPDLINAPSSGGNQSPLYVAAARGQLKVASFLLDNNAEINAKEGRGWTPLHGAVANGHTEMARLLLSRGANPNANDAEENDRASSRTPLHLAASRGYKSLVEVLLAARADANAHDAQGNTPLHDAVAHGYKSIVEVLLAAKADPDARNREGDTPLHEAAAHGFKAGVELLLANGAKVDARNSNKVTPLMKAAQNGNLAIADFLIAHGADVNARGDGGAMALLSAVMGDHLDVVRLLLAQGAEVNAALSGQPGADDANATALHLAVERNQIELVQLLLDKGANPNVRIKHGLMGKSFEGVTPLAIAAAKGEKEVAALLVSHKADLNTPCETSDDSLDPLLAAVRGGKTDLVELLSAAGADVSVKDRRGYTPLHWAVINQATGICTTLLEHSADPNALAARDESPLHYGASFRNKDLVELLLKRGAAVNQKDDRGDMPLDWAFRRSPYPNETDPTVMLLRAHGGLRSAEVSTLRVVRGVGQPQELFRKDNTGRNRITLFELIAHLYSQPLKSQQGFGFVGGGGGFQYPGTGLPFPDFTKLEIARLNPKGGRAKIKADVEAALSSSDCMKDVPLEWGDIVEIPEKEHLLNQQWYQVTDQMVSSLVNCLQRKVRLSSRGQTIEFALYPEIQTQDHRAGIALLADNSARSPSTSASTPEGRAAARFTFSLYSVVQQSGILRTSSDLTRVKVRRKESAGQPGFEAVFNVLNNPGNDDLWLRDGDEIEIPEKP